MKNKVISHFILLYILPLSLFSQNPSFELSMGHTENINSLDFSPDNKYLISSSSDKTIKLWELETGRVLRTFTGHKGEVRAAIFNKTMKSVISGDKSGKLIIWDILTGEIIQQFDLDYNINQIAILRDNKTLIVLYSDCSLKILDIEKETPIRKLDGCRLNSRRFFINPDETKLLTRNFNELVIIDLPHFDTYKTFKDHDSEISSFNFLADGNQIISTSNDGRLIIRNTKTGKKIKKEKLETDFENISPCENNNRCVASSMNGTIHFLETDTFTELHKLETNTNIWAFTISHDTKLLAIGGLDKSIQIIDLNTREFIYQFTGDLSLVLSLAVSKHNEFLLVGKALGDYNISLWNVKDGFLEGSYYADENNWSVAFDTSSSYFTYNGYSSSPSRIPVLDIGQDANKFFDTPSLFSDQLAFTGKSNLLVSSFKYKNIIKVWNIETGKELRIISLIQDISSFAVSPDEQFIAVSDGIITALYDFNTGKQILALIDENNLGNDLKFSGDGKLLAASGNGIIKIWEAGSTLTYRTFETDGQRNYSLAFSPEDKYIVSVNSNNSIDLWDVEAASKIKTFGAQYDEISCIAFSANGKLIISGNYDGSIKVWDAKSFKLLLNLYSFDNRTDWIAITPEGYFDGTKLAMKQLHFVKGLHSFPIENFF